MIGRAELQTAVGLIVCMKRFVLHLTRMVNKVYIERDQNTKSFDYGELVNANGHP